QLPGRPAGRRGAHGDSCGPPAGRAVGQPRRAAAGLALARGGAARVVGAVAADAGRAAEPGDRQRPAAPAPVRRRGPQRRRRRPAVGAGADSLPPAPPRGGVAGAPPAHAGRRRPRRSSAMTSLSPAERRASATWRDYLELTKPRVVLLMLITSLIGMFLATRSGVPWAVLLFGNLGIALCAGAAATVNHVVDRHIDGMMARTRRRPVTSGRVSPRAALTFALLLALAGQALLLAFTNPLTAWLTLASLVGYAAIYTGFLKRATPQNIVIGG